MDFESITIGTAAAFFGVIFAAAAFVWKWFNKAYSAKQKAEYTLEQIDRHDSQIKEIKNDLREIKEILLQQNENTKQVTICSLRAVIWDIHRRCMTQGYVTKEDIITFGQAVKVYEEAGGNDIVHEKLSPEVMGLPIKD